MIISVIIPAFNEESNIGKCLESLNNIKLGNNTVETIIVDNGSKDNTVMEAKKHNAKVYILPNVTIGALRNYGAKQARGDILAFLDADCIVSDSWLIRALKDFDNIQVAATGSPHRVANNASWVAKAWGLNNQDMREASYVSYIPSGNLFVRKKCFEEISGFKESLMVSEDTELCRSLREKGYEILSDPSIEAIHLGAPETLRKFYLKELWHGKETFKIFLHTGANKRVVLYALTFVALMMGLMLSIIFIRFEFAVSIAVAMLVIPLFIAIKTSFNRNNFKYLTQLWIIYLVYGIARAICILNIRNWMPHKSN